MAIAALIGMNQQRGIGWMAADTECRVEDIAVTAGGVVDITWMASWRFFV